MNLRQLAITDMKSENLKDWSLPIEIMSPDGKWQIADKETGEQLRAVRIVYDYRKIDADTGGEILVHEPIVTVALSSLLHIPKAGEKAAIKFSKNPAEPNTLTLFLLTPDRAPEGGDSLGIINLFPIEAEQS